MRSRPWLVTALIAAGCLSLASPGAYADGGRLAGCSTVQVRSVELKIRSGMEIMPDQPVSVNALRDAQQAEREGSRADVKVSVLGPVLGSMDSPHIQLDTSCEAGGILLTATITRSADYLGSVQKYATWRPEVIIALAMGQPHITLAATWKMRLTNGAVVSHAQTPPYAPLDYPLHAKGKIP